MKTRTFAPFSLVAVNCHEALSQETPAFTATLIVGGASYEVRNSGTGDANIYSPPLKQGVQDWLDKWCAEHLPAITDCGGTKLCRSIPMDFETWSFERAFAVAR